MIKMAEDANQEGSNSSLVAKKIWKQLKKKHPNSRVIIG
jgi:FMN-dependent NADH-azoreductase